MNEINETEQWYLNGECNKCRRERYCTKECKAKKRRIENVIIGAIEEKTGIVSMINYLNRL